MNLKFPLYIILLGVALVGALSACNSDDSSTSYYSAASTQSTEISDFTLGENDSVLSNLDSVYFTIDQKQGLIYNADSLPKGTDVTHLTATITFPNTVSQAQFHVTGGEVMADSTFDYTSTTTDSIDFTGHVELNVISSSQQQKRTYIIKVNVHQMEPDSLLWNLDDRRTLPGINSQLIDSKTVRTSAGYATLVQDGKRWVIGQTASLATGQWDLNEVTFPFTPAAGSLEAAGSTLYILDAEGNLYSSTDMGTSWKACGVQWYSILGTYNDEAALGVVVQNGQAVADIYPRPAGYEPQRLPADFPVCQSSPLMAATNEWTLTQQSLLLGGRTVADSLVNTTWGFDGECWGEITNEISTLLPALQQPVIVPYYSYDYSTTTLRATKRVTWILLGGRKSDGSINRTTFVSYDQGITWSPTTVLMHQPDYMPSFYGAQIFVEQATLSGSSAPARGWSVTKPVTEWDVPYLYLAGGRGESGDALPYVWKGVINRIAFKPVY